MKTIKSNQYSVQLNKKIISFLLNGRNKTKSGYYNLNKVSFMLLISLFLYSMSCKGQTLNANWVSKYKDKSMEKSFSSSNDTPDNSGKLILLFTPSFPITFSRIEKDTAKNWRIGPQATIGGSYFFVFGNGYKNANGTVQIEPYLVFGISVEAGFSQNLEKPGTIGNLNLGAVLGVYKYFNFLCSYDLLNNRTVFGIGARVDLFAITQGAGTVILNPKKFFGENLSQKNP